MRIERDWPKRWRTARDTGVVLVSPLPHGRFSPDGWRGSSWFDGGDAKSRQFFQRSIDRHWRNVREGDIWIEGPFAGLLAH